MRQSQEMDAIYIFPKTRCKRKQKLPRLARDRQPETALQTAWRARMKVLLYTDQFDSDVTMESPENFLPSKTDFHSGAPTISAAVHHSGTRAISAAVRVTVKRKCVVGLVYSR
ncbi:hypothetical protein ElyMa_006574100 [Elysia marginata]|uniref:Uncharacterized protein n=1 Tax=Elysia marginata TaxID=1093978 RepID=A0AAV4ICL9_9GAST|nr:hypothetical protein ElyMa_006574100 [Elysia marginata]